MKIEIYIYIYILFVEITYIIHFFINLNTSRVVWPSYLEAMVCCCFKTHFPFNQSLWSCVGNTRDDKSFKSLIRLKAGNWLLGLLVLGLQFMPRIGLLVRLAALLILPQLIYLIFFPYLPIRPYTQKGVSLPSAKNSKKKRKETIN